MTDGDQIAFSGVAGQARLLATGEVTSRSLVDLLLARVDRLQPRLNPFRTVFAERVRTEANAADAARAAGDSRPLLGVPIAVKDNVHVAGHGAKFGTGSPEPPAREDDELVRRLREAGMLVMGATQLPELALWGVTETRWHGVTRNPWAFDRAPGGSSGGSAVAVAAGLVPAAHATDGLGSIRIPASSCGLVGLKPTRGLVPLGPNPDHWYGLSHAGFLTRDVRDTVLLLDAVLGTSYADGSPAGALRVAASASVPPWRVDPAVRAAFDSAVETVRGLGHEVVDRDPPYGNALANANSVRYLRGLADDIDTLADPSKIEPRTRKLVWAARRLPERSVAWARAQGEAFGRRMSSFFEHVDVLVTPTVARLPASAGELERAGLLRTLQVMVPYAVFTQPWNACGFPAMSIPAGTSPDGLPVGLQLVGPPHSEARLLGLATQLEQALRWSDRRPDLG